jgi:hypothetical protein
VGEVTTVLLFGLSLAAISGSAASYYFFLCGKDDPVPSNRKQNITLCLIVAVFGIFGLVVSILQMTE